MSVTVQFEGGRELERALQDLGSLATQKAVLRRAARVALEPMAERARQLAPERLGHLKRSITVGTRISGPDAGGQAFAAVLRGGGTREEAVMALRDARRSQTAITMYVGPGRHPQAITQEFGTRHHGLQPFMRPAFDAEGRKTLDRLAAAIWADIQRTAARQARRAARQAARG